METRGSLGWDFGVVFVFVLDGGFGGNFAMLFEGAWVRVRVQMVRYIWSGGKR